LYDPVGSAVRTERAPEQVAGVRGDRADLLLRAVESEGVRPLGLPPHLLVDPVEQDARLAVEAAGVLRPAEDLVDVAHPELRVVDVALQRAGRDRQVGEAAIRVEDRVARVLPALVVVAVGRAGLVLLEPVSVQTDLAGHTAAR